LFGRSSARASTEGHQSEGECGASYLVAAGAVAALERVVVDDELDARVRGDPVLGVGVGVGVRGGWSVLPVGERPAAADLDQGLAISSVPSAGATSMVR
jgi:hypothetical protein